MSKEVSKAQTNAVSTNVSKGISGQLGATDSYRPMLTVTTSTSDVVKSGDVPAGCIINTALPEDILANRKMKDRDEKSLDFMLVGIIKYWVENDADTRDFITKYPGNDANEKPWEETINGRNIKRTFVFSYLVILADEIKDGLEQPIEFPFRSTAVKETKKLNSLIERLAAKNISSSQKVFKASVVERSNAKDTWFGAELSISRDATEEERACADSYLAKFEAIKSQFMRAPEQKSEAASAGQSQAQSSQAYKVSDEDLNSAQF